VDLQTRPDLRLTPLQKRPRATASLGTVALATHLTSACRRLPDVIEWIRGAFAREVARLDRSEAFLERSRNAVQRVQALGWTACRTASSAARPRQGAPPVSHQITRASTVTRACSPTWPVIGVALKAGRCRPDPLVRRQAQKTVSERSVPPASDQCFCVSPSLDLVRAELSFIHCGSGRGSLRRRVDPPTHPRQPAAHFVAGTGQRVPRVGGSIAPASRLTSAGPLPSGAEAAP
jgi:hypothetical protein